MFTDISNTSLFRAKFHTAFYCRFALPPLLLTLNYIDVAGEPRQRGDFPSELQLTAESRWFYACLEISRVKHIIFRINEGNKLTHII